MTEAEIIRQMRRALDVLKEKYIEEAGGWAVLDFISATHDEGHWMRLVVQAEELSEPYLLVVE